MPAPTEPTPDAVRIRWSSEVAVQAVLPAGSSVPDVSAAAAEIDKVLAAHKVEAEVSIAVDGGRVVLTAVVERRMWERRPQVREPERPPMAAAMPRDGRGSP